MRYPTAGPETKGDCIPDILWVMRRNTVYAIVLLLAAIMIAGALGVMRLYGLR